MIAEILILTVNEHEDRELKQAFQDAGFGGIGYQGDSLRHYQIYENVNGANIAVSKSEMGSHLEGAAEDAVTDAIDDFKPELVLCVGIAWGGDESEQKIGDVLLSTQVQIGSNAKIAERKTTYRGPRPSSRITAISTLRQVAEEIGQTVHSGIILSKEDLFDNKSQRNAALAASGAIGGEMEAMGVFKALQKASIAEDKAFGFAVAKAICDWGYKKNAPGARKETNQKRAAKNAANLIVCALSKYSFLKKKIAPN